MIPSLAIFEFAAPVKSASPQSNGLCVARGKHFTGQAEPRKMSFRYSGLCGTAFDAVDAVKCKSRLVAAKLEERRRKGFKFLELK